MPITVSEQIESTQEAFEAGASIVHAHVRNDDETPLSDPEKFVALNFVLGICVSLMALTFDLTIMKWAADKKTALGLP